jgi:conjugative relaxase-like TrwC/TraI family protein
MMTVHVLHAGEGYLYLIRSVAAHDQRLAPGSSLASYYTASGQPPGRWAGRGARRLAVHGAVTEEQMRSLFGGGLHPNAIALQASMVATGMSHAAATQAVRLGRRFPQYGRTAALQALARRTYRERETQLHRPLSEAEKLVARQESASGVFEPRTGRSPLDPVELESLGDQTSRREAVAGYDLTFTPVKSVAVLWGLGSDATRQQISEAHEAAVADALNWLESNAALTRTGDRGQAQINTTGLIAAQFRHWDSRAGDPDLHTHVAISNKVQGLDEKWRSLDGRTLFAAAVSISERYNTRIEDELRARLGVRFEERARGGEGRRPVREIAGMPESLLSAFSKRRHGIEQQYRDLLVDYRRHHGREPGATTRHALYQQATLSERPDKQRGRSLQQMVLTWRQEAATVLGIPDVAVAVEAATLRRGTGRQEANAAGLADQVLAALTASRATWNVHHLRAEAHRQSRGLHVPDRDRLIEAVVAAATGPEKSIQITTPRTLPEPPQLRRADGESVFVEHGSTLYTTTEILDAEERIVQAACAGTATRLLPTAVKDALERSRQSGRALNDGQASLVRAFCCSGRVVQLGLAPAGTGKTTAMHVVTDAWRRSGHPAVALAPSAAAADVLGQELGIPADTLAKFDYDEPAIAAGTLILVDEAGMAGTLMLDRLVRRAATAGAVVRLVGDDQQLAAVEAGGVLRHLDHEVGAVRMQQVVRFADADEAAATLQVRDGIADAADFYINRGRVLAGTDATMPDAAYAAWLEDVRAGRDCLLLASSTATVAELNARARADLILAGQVDVDGVPLRSGSAAGVGDRITTRRNERRLAVNGGRDWVKNGDSWRVLAVHGDGALTVAHRRHRGRVVLPADYVEDQVELDYARTVRRAQGLTVDHAHLLVSPQLTREEFYVGVSRARQGTKLYVASMTDDGPDHHPQMAGATRDVLAEIITRSGAEPSASQAVRNAVASIGDLRRMAVEYEYALGVHVGDRYRAAAEAAHPGVTADPVWPSVAQRLHVAEGAGWPVADILDRAERMGGYADARSDTHVLVFRLDLLLSRPTSEATPAPVPSWLAAAPPGAAPTPWDTYLPGRYREMADRITTLAETARAEPATWLTSIGNGPQRSEAIRQTVAYRAVYAITSNDPLGPEPDRHGRQHDAWGAAHRAITASRDPNPERRGSGAAQILATLQRDHVTLTDDPASPTRTGPTRHL